MMYFQTIITIIIIIIHLQLKHAANLFVSLSFVILCGSIPIFIDCKIFFVVGIGVRDRSTLSAFEEGLKAHSH